MLTARAEEILRSRAKGVAQGERLFAYRYLNLQRALKAAVPEGSNITWHTFRHANATLRARANQDPRTQQQQMGHSNIQRTMSYGLNDDDLANANGLDDARPQPDAE